MSHSEKIDNFSLICGVKVFNIEATTLTLGFSEAFDVLFLVVFLKLKKKSFSALFLHISQNL